MTKINIGRVILGGILAGVIIDVFEYVLNGVVLASKWPTIMQSINRPPLGMHDIVHFNIIGLVLGIASVWTYAAIRPRFGAGVKTAVYAALLVWVVGYLLADAPFAILRIYSWHLAAVMVVVGLVEIIVATIAGAWLYKEA